MLELWKQYVTLCGTKMYSISNFGIQTPTPTPIIQEICFKRSVGRIETRGQGQSQSDPK